MADDSLSLRCWSVCWNACVSMSADVQGCVLTFVCSTVRAMITENSTKKTQAKAFSYFAFANNLGIFFGPLMGMFTS